MVNVAMLIFLNLSVVEEGHSLSPFCKNFSSEEELVASVKYFFSSKMLAQNNRESSEDIESIEDSDGNRLSNEM